MKTRRRKTRSAFNLLETLLASSLLAGAVMTIGSLSGHSISTVRIDQEIEKAWELADTHLKMMDAVGLSAFQDMGKYSGEFEQAEGYTWKVEIEELQIDHLFSVTLTVQWPSGGQVRQIRCRTRFCDPPDPEELEMPEE